VAAPDWYRPPGASVVIGFGARLAPQKRPEDVIRAAALLAGDYPGAAFVIAGEGSRRADYETLARSLGVERTVRFVGYVPDMRSFYASVDIVVLPSRSEGCPYVVLESLAMRTALWGATHDRDIEASGRSILLGVFLRNYFSWVVRPLWLLVFASGISPNAVTIVATTAGCASGLAVALGHLALGGWLFILSGI